MKVASRVGVAVMAGGLALSNVLGVPGAARGAGPPAVGTVPTVAAAPAQAWWLWVSAGHAVFTVYGGRKWAGITAAELVYSLCQHNGVSGWQSYAWVPSLRVYGWITNGDLTGYPTAIPGLTYC